MKFEGRDLLALREPEMRKIRGSAIAMVFREPMASLNPVHHGAALHRALSAEHLRWSHHAARYNALGREYAREYSAPRGAPGRTARSIGLFFSGCPVGRGISKTSKINHLPGSRAKPFRASCVKHLRNQAIPRPRRGRRKGCLPKLDVAEGGSVS